ncbi:MAG: hypothetical protein MI919_26355 [Holophagales bacterium]|nr:hypothetical protein [Holophagales bacterium]
MPVEIPEHKLVVTIVAGKVEISNNGDVEVDSLPAFIDFDLQTSNSQDKIHGIQISSSSANLTSQPSSDNTSGQWYGSTCFMIENHDQQRLLRLIDQDRTGIDCDISWHYRLGVKPDRGSVIWSDPKIYNRGDEIFFR